ncbi:MAG: sporulation protein YtfJ, partial [Ruminococcus sp.]|nr:sporulation protein YtfJ [Ruminococcus sp.]
MNTGKTSVSDLLGISMEKIKEMADVNAIIGDPIKLDDGTTIIPISKVSYGFASGGSDLPSKYDKNLFGGGAGAG